MSLLHSRTIWVTLKGFRLLRQGKITRILSSNYDEISYTISSFLEYVSYQSRNQGTSGEVNVIGWLRTY